MIRDKEDTKVYTLEFESVSEIVDWSNSIDNIYEENKHLWKKWQGRYDSDTSSQNWWLGCLNYTEVDKLVLLGWDEGLGRMESCEQSLGFKRPVSIKRRRKWGPMGSRISLPRVYSGQLNRAWSTLERRVAIGIRKVSIYVNLLALANVSSEQLFWKGAAAVVLSDMLTVAGYSVQIIGYGQSRGGIAERAHWDLDVRVTVPLKEYTQPLNRSILAATTGLSGFGRKCIFAAFISSPYEFVSGLGRSREGLNFTPEYDRDELIIHITKTRNVWDENAAKSFIQKCYEDLNSEIKHTA